MLLTWPKSFFVTFFFVSHGGTVPFCPTMAVANVLQYSSPFETVEMSNSDTAEDLSLPLGSSLGMGGGSALGGVDPLLGPALDPGLGPDLGLGPAGRVVGV